MDAEIHLTKDSIINTHNWRGRLDLLHIVMIGLTKALPERDEKYELHRLLGTLLSDYLTANEKLEIIGEEYNIPLRENFREDVRIMCNLSMGIRESAAEAAREATVKEFVISMNEKGYTIKQIAEVAGIEEKQVKEIIESAKMLMV